MAIDPPNRPTTNMRPPLRSADRPKPALLSEPTKSIAENIPPVSASKLLRPSGSAGSTTAEAPASSAALSLRRVDVGDDRTKPIERMAQADRSKAKAARANDQEWVLGIDGRGFFQRAESREAGTPERRRERRRQRFIFDQVSWMLDQNIVAEAAVSMDAEVARFGAQILLPRPALRAASASAPGIDRAAVADLHARRVRPELFDDACDLVAEDARQFDGRRQGRASGPCRDRNSRRRYAGRCGRRRRR